MYARVYVKHSVHSDAYWYAILRDGGEIELGIGKTERKAAERALVNLKRAVRELESIIDECVEREAEAAQEGE